MKTCLVYRVSFRASLPGHFSETLSQNKKERKHEKRWPAVNPCKVGDRVEKQNYQKVEGEELRFAKIPRKK